MGCQGQLRQVKDVCLLGPAPSSWLRHSRVGFCVTNTARSFAGISLDLALFTCCIYCIAFHFKNRLTLPLKKTILMYFHGWHTASTCLLYEYIKDKLYLFYDKYEYVVFFLNLHSTLLYTYQTVALSVSCAIPVLQYWAVIVVAIFFSRLGFSRNMVGKV